MNIYYIYCILCIYYIYIYILMHLHRCFLLATLCDPLPPSFWWGFEPSTKFSKEEGGLREFQFLEESYLERRGGLFKGGFQFLHGE